MLEKQAHRFVPILIGINAGIPVSPTDYLQKHSRARFCEKTAKTKN